MKSCWNLRLSKCCTFVFSLIIGCSWAQSNATKAEPPGGNFESENYLFPIEPGTPNSLAGTMGELRSNHFHSGIDVRTGNRIGVPVLAAQKGYVSRIAVSPYGFGNAVYVTHPNGQITVYGHLNTFNKVLGDYVRDQQYRKKSFDVNLYFKAGTFNVMRGDTIAFSGNTGGSAGPHLHFDIRDKNNEALNPLQFKFDEITDRTPPIVQKVALRTMDINSRINDQFGRFEFYVTKDGDNYTLPFPILAHGSIGVEFLGYDRLEDSRARCGINFVEAWAGDTRVFKQTIDKINFAETRNILMLMDYKTLQNSGERFNKLFIDDGNDLAYYSGTPEKGIISVKDEEVPVKIVLRDTYGNQSLLNFQLRPTPVVNEVRTLQNSSKSISYELLENTFILSTRKELGDTALLFVKGDRNSITPSYFSGTRNVYLLDLRKTLPDSIAVGKEIIQTHFKDMVPSEVAYKYYSDQVDISFARSTLYDTLFLKVNYSNSDKEIFSIGDSTVPLHRNITVTLKPKQTYTENYSVYRNEGKYFSYVGGTWANGRITFSTREFGEYTIMQDTQAPTITKIAVNGGAARFKIQDDLSGISYFEANINGEWLLMNYDYKTRMIWAERKDRSKPLQGDISVKVVDNAGNENIYKQKIL